MTTSFLSAAYERLQEPESHLSKTTYLKHIKHQELRKFILTCYKHKSPAQRCVGSILNALYTERRIAFKLSRSTVREILEGDINYKSQPKPWPENLNQIQAILTTPGFFTIEAPQQGKRATVFKACPDFINAFGFEAVDLQAQLTLCLAN